MTTQQYENTNPVQVVSSSPVYQFESQDERSEFAEFAEMTRKLVQVPKSEIDAEREKA